MKIDYKILWFEDRPKDIESNRLAVEASIEDRGFRPVIEIISSITVEGIDTLADKLSRYNSYDLIVFDYDLGEGPNGAQVAASLRKRVWTDMVFYSGKRVTELREILYNNGVDAVFPVHRPNLAEELGMIVEDHVRKMCDLNNMRGIVIDEICKIERLMRTVTKDKVAELSDDQKETILNKIKKKTEQSGKRQIASSEQMDCALTALTDHSMTDFNVVRTRLWSLVKASGEHLYLKDGFELQKYQNLRNRFAHVSAELDESAGHITLADDDSEIFDYEKFEEIRKELRQLSESLKTLE